MYCLCEDGMALQAVDSQEIVLFETQDTGVTWIAMESSYNHFQSVHVLFMCSAGFSFWMASL